MTRLARGDEELNTRAWFLDVIEEALLAIGCVKTAAITHDAAETEAGCATWRWWRWASATRESV